MDSSEFPNEFILKISPENSDEIHFGNTGVYSALKRALKMNFWKKKSKETADEWFAEEIPVRFLKATPGGLSE